MFKQGQTVLVTGDWEDNNTKGKLGIILKIDGSDYKIGFLKKLNKSNSDTYWSVSYTHLTLPTSDLV